jgi:hypothetical protein
VGIIELLNRLETKEMTIDLTPDQAEALVRACQLGERQAEARLAKSQRPDYRRFIEYEREQYKSARKAVLEKFPTLTEKVKP